MTHEWNCCWKTSSPAVTRKEREKRAPAWWGPSQRRVPLADDRVGAATARSMLQLRINPATSKYRKVSRRQLTCCQTAAAPSVARAPPARWRSPTSCAIGDPAFRVRHWPHPRWWRGSAAAVRPHPPTPVRTSLRRAASSLTSPQKMTLPRKRDAAAPRGGCHFFRYPRARAART